MQIQSQISIYIKVVQVIIPYISGKYDNCEFVIQLQNLSMVTSVHLVKYTVSGQIYMYNFL